MIYLHGGPEGQSRPGYDEIFARLVNDGITVLTPNVRGSGGFGRTFGHADDKEQRFAAIDDVADCVRFLIDNELADPRRIACAGWSYGGYLTMAAMTFHPALFAAGITICGMSDLTTFYRNTEQWIADGAYTEVRPPGQRPRAARAAVPAATCRCVDRTVAGGARSPRHQRAGQRIGADRRRAARGRSRRALPALQRRRARIVKRENRATLAATMSEWLNRAFDETDRQSAEVS